MSSIAGRLRSSILIVSKDVIDTKGEVANLNPKAYLQSAPVVPQPHLRSVYIQQHVSLASGVLCEALEAVRRCSDEHDVGVGRG